MRILPNQFSTYELTAAEEVTGAIFNQFQEAVLRNKLAQIAQSKLTIQFNPMNPLEFAQREAYERGQMDVITWLLDSSIAVQAELTTAPSDESEFDPE